MIRHKIVISFGILLVILYFGYVKLFNVMEEIEDEFDPLKELERIQQEEIEEAERFLGDDEEVSNKIINALSDFSMNKKIKITTTEETSTTSSTTTANIKEIENEEEPKKLLVIDQETAIYDADLEEQIINAASSTTAEPEVVSDQSETLSQKLPVRLAGKSGCPDFGENFSQSPEPPKYELDGNRFISHFVSNGPNNQIVDFRNGLFWAIKLNITTTLPLFYEHFTVSNARSNTSSILPKHRIKLDSRLLSSISPEEFGKRCSNQEIALLDATPDSANQFQLQKRQRLPKLYEFYGIDKSFVTRFQPVLKHKILTKNEDFASNWPARSRNYNCTIFAHPYRSKFIKKSEQDEKLWEEIIRATPRPQYISKLAEEFIEQEMSQRFLAIHWRNGTHFDQLFNPCGYDRKDFLSKNRCKKYIKSKRKRRGLLSYDRACKEFYPLLSDLTPLTTKILEFTVEHNFRHVFLALPPIEIPLGNSIKEKLAQEKVFVHMEGALQRFVFDKYPDCDYFGEHRDDMLSLLEQEIVSKSAFFIRSLASTWSSNIYNERISHGINNTISVLDLMDIDIYAKPKPDK